MDFRELILFAWKFIFDLNKNNFMIINILGDNTLEPLTSYYILRKRNIKEILVSEKWLIEYDNIQFFMFFRMEKATFDVLCGVLKKIDRNGILRKKRAAGYAPVELKLQVLVFIWFMATQDSLISIGDRFKVSHTSVMNIVNRLLYFIVQLKTEYIKFPKSIEELEIVSQGFPTYPGVIGAIDGTHIFLKVSKEQQDSYIDRYKRHSIIVMAICDSKGLFTYAFTGFPGSAHDSRVFQQSQFFRYVTRNGPNSLFIDDNNYHLVGDSAFGLKTWLMTPYRDNANLTRQQRQHNYRLSSARVIIEHAFGLLKGRWRRLIYINTYTICKAIEIASAALVLHNFCILNCDLWREPFQDEREENYGYAEVEGAARTKRDRIAGAL